jgi:transcriptional regulator with XRE-family HTH domain
MNKKKQPKKGSNMQKELQALMTKHNLSREDIASRLGVSSMTIYRWAQGKTFPKSRFMLREFEALKKQLSTKAKLHN